MNWTAFLDEAIEGIQKPELPDDIQLPILPNVISEFAQKADDPNVNAKQLAAVIEVDSGLTCELLKHVNSAAIGLRRQAVSPQQAITLLGVRQSKLFLLTRGLRASLRGLSRGGSDKKLIDYSLFWNTNLERALFAREFAKVIKADFDVAFAAAMLQDMMLPVLCGHNSDIYEQFIEGQTQQPVPLIDFENEKLGYNHAVAATFVMRDWNFPDDLVACVLHHHRGVDLLDDSQLGKTAVAAVGISSLLTEQLHQVPDGISTLAQLDGVISGFRLERIAGDVDEQFEELASRAENRRPLLDRCREALAATTTA